MHVINDEYFPDLYRLRQPLGSLYLLAQGYKMYLEAFVHPQKFLSKYFHLEPHLLFMQ